MPGNAILQEQPYRRPPKPKDAPLMTVEQARLNRTASPPGLAFRSQVRWERAFRTDSREALQQMIDSLTPKVAALRAQVANPPDYWHGSLWTDAANRLDEWEGMLEAARKALVGGRSSDPCIEQPSACGNGSKPIPTLLTMMSRLLDW